MSTTLYTGKITRTPIDVTAGITELHAAVAGYALVVLGMTVVAESAGCTFYLAADTTRIAGPFDLTSFGVLPLNLSKLGHANTAAGEALNVVVTAGAMGGVIQVQETRDAN